MADRFSRSVRLFALCLIGCAGCEKTVTVPEGHVAVVCDGERSYCTDLLRQGTHAIPYDKYLRTVDCAAFMGSGQVSARLHDAVELNIEYDVMVNPNCGSPIAVHVLLMGPAADARAIHAKFVQPLVQAVLLKASAFVSLDHLIRNKGLLVTYIQMYVDSLSDSSVDTVILHGLRITRISVPCEVVPKGASAECVAGKGGTLWRSIYDPSER